MTNVYHQKLWIGAHTSASGGVQNAIYEGSAIGATTVQLFTSNQKQWSGKTLSAEEIAAWQKALDETGLDQVMCHDSYLINLGSSKEDVLMKSRKAFSEELHRCHLLKIPYLNFHPGAAAGGTEEQCLETIVESLLEVEGQAQQGPTRLLLETTAGQGTCVGWKFEQIGALIQALEHKIPIGVCIDTCHIFVAGYDIRTEEGWQQTLEAFDREIGLKHLYAFHVNDSQKEFGSRVDRHAPLGQGKIGIESFKVLMTHPATRLLPKYLETPDGPALWKEEIALLKQFAETYAYEN